MKALEERMKEFYEKRWRFKLPRRTPVIIRVDGQAFHTFTKGMGGFNPSIINGMALSAEGTMGAMCGCKVAYIQSDEASFLLTDYETHQTEAWFDYNLQKLASITASTFTAHFNSPIWGTKIATFDARAFSIPKEEVVNYFLWRAKDWHRNSVLMYAQQFFSHSQLHKKKLDDVHEMLYGIGKNWAVDLSPQEKNGTFIIDDEYVTDFIPKYDNINELIGKYV
jgi:tRNA(His) 5'-end guanylyltransferase